jgi:hypothetical protein
VRERTRGGEIEYGIVYDDEEATKYNIQHGMQPLKGCQGRERS